MNEIVTINLDNEMDLILAHKRTMKLAEFCGLSVSAQTVFATAVSEICRNGITYGKQAYLVLGINNKSKTKKEIVASVFDVVDLSIENLEAWIYAKKLVDSISLVEHMNGFCEIRLTQDIPYSNLLSPARVESFKDYFTNEPPISPYDEIRKKNIHLIELAGKLQESENQYKQLTDNLPIMMFMINNKGEVVFSNKWLIDFFGASMNVVTSISWQSLMHPDDYKTIWKEWDRSQLNRTAFRAQGRLKDSKDNYLWHLISIVPLTPDKGRDSQWIGFFVDIHSQKVAELQSQGTKQVAE